MSDKLDFIIYFWFNHIIFCFFFWFKMHSHWPGHKILLFSSGNHVGGGALSTFIVGTSEEGNFPLMSRMQFESDVYRSHACCFSGRSGPFRFKRNCICRCILWLCFGFLCVCFVWFFFAFAYFGIGFYIFFIAFGFFLLIDI